MAENNKIVFPEAINELIHRRDELRRQTMARRIAIEAWDKNLDIADKELAEAKEKCATLNQLSEYLLKLLDKLNSKASTMKQAYAEKDATVAQLRSLNKLLTLMNTENGKHEQVLHQIRQVETQIEDLKHTLDDHKKMPFRQFCVQSLAFYSVNRAKLMQLKKIEVEKNKNLKRKLEKLGPSQHDLSMSLANDEPGNENDASVVIQQPQSTRRPLCPYIAMTLEDYSVLLEDSAISHSNAHHAPNHRPACTHSSRNISQHTRRLVLITYLGQCIEKRIKGEVKERRGSLGRPRGRLSDLSGQPSLGLARGEDHAARAPSAQLKPAQDQDLVSEQNIAEDAYDESVLENEDNNPQRMEEDMPMEEAEIHRPVINTQRKDVPTSQTESISGASENVTNALIIAEHDPVASPEIEDDIPQRMEEDSPMEEAESQQIDENNTQTKDVFTSQTEFVFNGSGDDLSSRDPLDGNFLDIMRSSFAEENNAASGNNFMDLFGSGNDNTDNDQGFDFNFGGFGDGNNTANESVHKGSLF
ncbi:hypothetical protein DdX_05979 [Ditylenchus destructor]|uniref:Uncharacterized protein n=1 Tax=Ditylenchus destructor TaxID=166010 RepID=A0AAD4N802_9BILA|nr:hypothetical protein DdX_05979 [Ditylenchus destructor]